MEATVLDINYQRPYKFSGFSVLDKKEQEKIEAWVSSLTAEQQEFIEIIIEDYVVNKI